MSKIVKVDRQEVMIIVQGDSWGVIQLKRYVISTSKIESVCKIDYGE